MMQRASRSTVSLLLKILSSIRASATSSSLGLRRWKEHDEVEFKSGTEQCTYRPGSYSIDAIGESSQWIVIKPSNGRWGSGRTIFASTWASTLQNMRSNDKCLGDKEVACEPYRVLPSEHSTWPSSTPKESEWGRASRNSRPSRRRFWSSAAEKKSFSGIEGDGGRMMDEVCGCVSEKRKSLDRAVCAPVRMMRGRLGVTCWSSRLRTMMMAYYPGNYYHYYSQGLFDPYSTDSYRDDPPHYPEYPSLPSSSLAHTVDTPLPSTIAHKPSTGKRKRSPPRSSPSPPPAPSEPPPTRPSPSYLDFASKPSKTLREPTRKLLILDLNGTLLLRSPRPPKSSRGQYHQPHPAPRRVLPRPYLATFRAYLFALQTRAWLDVMVWSSAQPHSVEDMVSHAIGDDREYLVAIWARDTLGLADDHYRASFLLSISPRQD